MATASQPRRWRAARVPSRADQRADAGEEEDRHQRHGERVGGVAEEEREALDQRDLEGDERQTEQAEDRRRRPLVRERAPRAADERERQEQEDGRHHDGDAEQQDEDALADPHLDVDARHRVAQPGEHLRVGREVPEEGPVVGDRADVVADRTSQRRRTAQDDGVDRPARIVAGTTGKVARRRPRHLGRLGLDAIELVGGEGRRLHHRRRTAEEDPDEEVVTTATWSATSRIPSAWYAFHAVDTSRVVRLGAWS